MNTDTNIQADPPVSASRILVPVDFSEDAGEALLWALRYARRTGGELLLLHVVHDPGSSPGFYRHSGVPSFEPMQSVAESMMEGFIEKLESTHPDTAPFGDFQQHFVPGLPPTRIVEVAALLQADLIVLGSRGLTGLPHRLLGSTSERVVELAPIPVVVVKSANFGKQDKKSRKREEKKLKKESRKLRRLLGLKKNKNEEADKDG